MAYYQSRRNQEIPGGFGLRIVMLLAALFSVIFMRAQCGKGVATVFDQVAPPQSLPTTEASSQHYGPGNVGDR
jgi:hypothetical protein